MTLDSTVPARDIRMKDNPYFFQEKRNSGTLMIRVMTPTGKPLKKLMIMAIPVTPPVAMALG